jgi:hypothetical protein
MELLSVNDRREEYINNLEEPQVKDLYNKMSAEEKLNHVLVDDFKGKKVKIKVFELIGDEMKHKQRVKLVRHQPSSLYACFVFAVYNVMEKKNDEEVQTV